MSGLGGEAAREDIEIEGRGARSEEVVDVIAALYSTSSGVAGRTTLPTQRNSSLHDPIQDRFIVQLGKLDVKFLTRGEGVGESTIISLLIRFDSTNARVKYPGYCLTVHSTFPSLSEGTFQEWAPNSTLIITLIRPFSPEDNPIN